MATRKKRTIRSQNSASSSTVRIPKYATGRGKKVWLTFDDGPHPSNTDVVLRTLDQFEIKATFFVVGENVARFPNIVRRTFDAGHRIGNHSYTHPNLTKLSQAAIKKEVEDTDRLIAQYQTAGTKIFRPPYGAHNATVDSIVTRLGYRLVFWSVDTLDWDPHNQPDRWIQLGIDPIRARDHSVVLNHDIHKTTADNLGEFIRRIIAIGNVDFQSPATL